MNEIQRPFIGQNVQFESQVTARSFISNVFSWMFLALAITAVVAYFAAESETFIRMLIHAETGGLNLMGWVVTLAPFALVLIMSFSFQRLSASNMILIFLLYAVLMGLSLSFVFLAYTGSSIAKTFIITAGTFGIMALVGYTTKTDLTRFGSIMMMGVIGIIIASLVNFFMKSGTLDYIISIVGVLIFTGLTAYDVQKLKRIGASNFKQGSTMSKISIMGALTLYLDFINLFLFLLRFFGNSRD